MTEPGPRPIRHHVVVNVPIDQAFTLFTDRFGDFKPREHNLLTVPIAETVFEPREGEDAPAPAGPQRLLDVIYSAGLRNDSAFPVIYRVVQVPMYLFSGAFFPLDAMPALVQWLATLNPLWHGVQLTRMAMLGTPEWGAIGMHVAVLLALGAVGTWWSVRRLTHRLIT